MVKNENPKFSYRNNKNYQIHHRLFSTKRLELVYTKYEVNRSIIKGDGCIQPFRAQNPVFSTLTSAWHARAALARGVTRSGGVPARCGRTPQPSDTQTGLMRAKLFLCGFATRVEGI